MIKYMGPGLLVIVLALCYSILFHHEWAWFLGGLSVAAVFVSVIATFVYDLKASKRSEP